MYKFPSDAAFHESEGTIAAAVSWLKLEFPTLQYATRVAADQRSVRRGEVESDQQLAWADPDMFDVFESSVVAAT
jgi:hypothetical protein